MAGVSDEDGLGFGLCCGGEQSAQIIGADHGGLVDHHQVEMPQGEGALVKFVEGYGDGVAGVAGTTTGRASTTLPVGAKTRTRPVWRRRTMVGQRTQGGGLTRTGGGAQRLHLPR